MKKLNKLTTNDMELALAMSKSSPCNFVKNQVVSIRCSDLFGHETDFISVNKSGYVTEVEIKISKSDFNNDFHKKHYHESGYIKYFYYAVPYYMKNYVMEHVPENVGILLITPAFPYGRVEIIKECIPRKGARKLTEEKILKLQRYMGMKYWSLLHRVRKYFWQDVVSNYKYSKKETKNDFK